MGRKLGRVGHALAFFCLLACNLRAVEENIVYPQLPIGGGFQAVLVISNPKADAWTGSVRLPAFGAGSGVDWLVNDQDMTGTDSFPVDLGPRASRRFVISAPSGAAPVSAVLTLAPSEGSSAGDLAMSLFYDYSVDDALVDSVSVPGSPAGRLVVVPVELSPGERINTGVAIVSESDSQLATEGPGPANPVQPFFRVSLYDTAGALLAETVRELAQAMFVDQIFSPEVFPEGRFVGSLAVESETAFHLLALRQRLLDAGRFQLTGVAPWIAPADTPVETFSARYRVTFQADWSAQTHPTNFPSAAHFSSLIGGVHDDSASFWQPGVLATPGIQRMAEEGRTNPLDFEVESAIRQSRAGRVLVGGGVSPSPGEVSLEFDINQRYPLVTLVSMIAPSPDWFVGVRGLNLFGDSGWIDTLTVDLHPYDAGTDDGASFLSPNAESQPHQPVSRLTGFPFLNQGAVLPMGRFVFTRLDGDPSGS